MRVHFERHGSGAPLLLLHGIGSSSRAFRHQLSDLADVFDMIAWDAPGYGQSEDPATAEFSIEDQADRAAQLLGELQLDSAHVLGVSMGGVVAQAMYHRHPERVRSLVLCDTNPGGGALPEPERSERVRQRVDNLMRLGAREMARQRAPVLVTPEAPPSLIQELAEIMAEVRPAGYCAAAVALGSTDLTPLLANIWVPTLVIHGACDRVVPLDTGRGLAESIPGARLVVIPDAGHVANQERPAAFNAAVREFLSALSS
jgi:pimeloyl-ACP methyl ester carboxylesterase